MGIFLYILLCFIFIMFNIRAKYIKTVLLDPYLFEVRTKNLKMFVNINRSSSFKEQPSL